MKWICWIRGGLAGWIILTSCGKHADMEAFAIHPITKNGTIDFDIVETTPVVFKDELYRFEYIRRNHPENKTPSSFFRFRHVQSGQLTDGFGVDFDLGSAFIWQDSVYVSAVNGWGSEKMVLFASADLQQWRSRPILTLPGHTLYNTSICRADDQFVLMYEIGDPREEAGYRFTARFATSHDLVTWLRTDPNRVYARDRYTAPHALRYHGGKYYLFYLEYVGSQHYETRVVRSADLMNWENARRGPVLKPSAADQVPALPGFQPEQLIRIREALNINNSDLDFCWYDGKMVLYYSWGDQAGTEFLAEGTFLGSEEEFLRIWFE